MLKWIHSIVFIISSLLVFLVYWSLIGRTNIFGDYFGNSVLSIGLGIPLFLLFLGYVYLRNLKVYLLWLSLAILMFSISVAFSDHPEIQSKRGSFLRYFQSLLIFLLTFQLLRVLFIRVMKREYVTPAKGGGTHLLEDQQPQIGDFIMFGILFASIILATGLLGTITNISLTDEDVYHPIDILNSA